ncbi:MAG TPA: molybdopterin-dependent oxidoreductase [Thermodesulfobacteriota bacterium]|nr:molybdopterin-dependent oxidoreductase [Thermodesulfobacteriota bacterium]
MITKSLIVNGIPKTLIVDPKASLADVLRKQLLLTGVKVGCNQGQCGACNVIMNGELIRSCARTMQRVPDGASITTIEGIGTPQNLHPLQRAWIKHGGAQCGFCTPGFIVSSKALLDTNVNPSRDEVRDWFQKHRNACRCTGYKHLVDAVMDAARVQRGEANVEDLSYQLPDDGRVWGSRYPRPSAVARVTGTVDYGADQGLKLPDGALHLALVQAKVHHATILSIDTAEAESMPGVEKVLTYKDIKGDNRIRFLLVLPGNRTDGKNRPILCDTKVFHYDDPLAIVCADSEAHAKAAVEKVKVKLEKLPAYLKVEEAMAEDAIEIHPGTPNVYFVQKIAKGEETAPIFKEAAYVVEDEFYEQRQPHLPIEPEVGFAYLNEEGKLVMHSKTCTLYGVHAAIHEGLGIEPDKLIMVQNTSGADFGCASTVTIQSLLGAACLATGKPVFLNFDYRQQQTSTGKRAPCTGTLRLAADQEGKLLAMEEDFSTNYGPYGDQGDLTTLFGTQFMGACYNIPNIRGQGRAVTTNHAMAAAFRGMGSTPVQFFSQVLMDKLAEKIGIDPFELHYKNVYRPGSTSPTSEAPEVYSFPEMLDLVRPKYRAALEKSKKESTATLKRGVGISLGTFLCGIHGIDQAQARVGLMPDGGVTVYATWEEHGQGADVGTLGTAHEALRPLGLPPEKIRLVMNDTSITPFSFGSLGSRSQVITGNAIRVSCEMLVEAMRKEDGTYRSYEEMIQDSIPLEYTGSWATHAGHLDENCQGHSGSVYQYGVFMAEVEVDITTGKTKVLKMTFVADIGKINNRLVVEGQFYGSLSQAVGLALSEEFEDVVKHSTMIGAGFPYIKDVPDDMELIFVETPRIGPFGAGGCGEIGLTSSHAAIINAIYNACGVRITKLPARPEKVLASLKAKQ